MANVIGTVGELNGTFYARNEAGELRELKSGDEVYEGEIIVPDTANALTDTVSIIPNNGTNSLLINSSSEQLLDSTLINTTLEDEELSFTPSSVNDGLRAQKFGGDDSDYTQENESNDQVGDFAALDGDRTDINSDLRDASWPNSVDYVQMQDNDIISSRTEAGSAFAQRDGDITDIVSDLRQAQWEEPEEEPIYEGEIDDEIVALEPEVPVVPTPEPEVPVEPTEPEPVEPEPVEPEPEVPVEPTEPEPEVPVEPTEPEPETPVTPPTPKTIIKIVAADASGTPLKDGDDNYIVVNETPEGGNAYYVALAFEPNTTVFNDDSKLDTQEGTVDFTFTDGTATTDTDLSAVEGTNDYKAQDNITTITLGTAVDIEALDDYIADNGEQLVVKIENYTTPDTPTGDYGVTTVDTSGVTTTITDNTDKPEGGTGEDTPPEDNSEDVIVKLIALDESGEPIIVDGKYTFANDVAEGSVAQYKALAFDSSNTDFAEDSELSVQLGSVTVSSADNNEAPVSGTDATAGDDYTALTTTTVALDTAFSIDTLDDYLADNGETYTVSIGSYVEPTTGDKYENVTASGTVTTTITDGANDATPNQDVDTVYLELSGDDIQGEIAGEKLTHTITLVDKDGNAVNLESGKSIEVTLTYSDIADKDPVADADFVADTRTTTFTLTGDGGSSYSFENAIKDSDGTFELSESYNVVIGTITDQTNTGFENVAISTTQNSANGTIVEGVVVEGENTISGTDDLLIGIVGTITSFTYIDENGDTQDGTVGTEVDTQYGKITVQANGNWSYTSDPTEDHTDGTLLDNIKYIITKTDGGTTSEHDFPILVLDTEPSVTQPDATVDEQHLADGTTPTPGSIVVTQNLAITKGADDIKDVQFDVSTITDLNSLSLKSQGSDISYTLSADKHTITANNGSNDVFTIVLNNPTNAAGTTQSYTFTLLDTIDHADGNAANTQELPFKFNLYDTDSTIEDNTFKVTIVDDIPKANAEAKLSVVEGEVALTGMIDLLQNDTQGADSVTLTGFTYTNESDTVVDGTFGTEVNTKYGALTVNSDGSWSYTSDATESNPSGTDAVTDSFNYTITDRDGDTSSAIQEIDITDGADPIIDPVDLTINEIVLGTDTSLTPFTSENNALNVAKGSDNIADTKFADDLSALNALGIKSGGELLVYALSGDKHTITATKTTSGEEVFKITITDPDSTSAKYDFKLSLPIDHTKATNDTEWKLPFKVYTVDTDDNGTVDADDDDIDTFEVTIEDSAPNNTDLEVETDEDTNKIIRLSQDDLSVVKITATSGGEVTLNTGNSTNIYDAEGDDVVGTLTNNGDGTVTFSPATDYSDNTTTPPTFTYAIEDDDGDSAGATVTIKVNPIADAPGVTVGDVTTVEDNTNTAEGTHSVALGLTKPTLSQDQTDKNDANGVANTGDHPERLGYIELKFTNGGDVTGAVVEKSGGEDIATISTNNQVIKVVITTDDGTAVDYNYHHNDIALGETGVTYLTTTEYQALQIIHAEDNDKDIKINIGVTSYEVDDSGVPLDTESTTLTKTTSDDMTVKINPATDDISLAWDTATGGSISQVDHGGAGGNNANNTFTFTNAVEEGSPAIDLGALLTKTSGTQNDATPLGGDLDGSEKRTYTVEGIPEGTILTVGSQSVSAGSDGKATLVFNNANNMDADPDFTLKLSEQWSGSITNAKITLSVTDEGADSTDTESGEKTAEVYFNIDATPVADQVTLKVAQAQGDEDAGRTDGNDAANDSDIDDAANGIELNINVISDDNKDISDGTNTNEKEKYTVSIDKVPDGGSLYVYDQSSTSWKLVTVSDDGSSVTIDGVSATTSGNITVDASADGTYKVTITDYQNDQLPKFIPPYNSDKNYTGADAFEVKAYSVDGSVDSSALTQTLTIDVTVDGVADIPVNDELDTVTIQDATNTDRTFNLVSTEDVGGINIKGMFATPVTLDSNDLSTADGSETLTFKVSGLEDGFGIEGATYIGGSGESRVWLVDIDDLNDDKVTLTTPEHYSGEVGFEVQFVTTENSGDSKTHDVKDVSVMITPVAEADAKVNNADEQDEDTSKVLDFGFTSPDTDGTSAGQESLESFSIDMDSVPAGVTLTGSTSGVLASTGVVNLSVVDGVLETVTATLAEDSDEDYSFNISYTYQDVAVDTAGNTYTDTVTKTDQAYSVVVNAITDDIDLSLATTAGTNNTVDGSGKVTVTGNGTFTKTLTVTGVDSDGKGSADTDGSEMFTRVTVSGVPEGITIVGGTYAGDTGAGNHSGFWYVDISNQTLDADGATYDLVFDVDGSFASGLPDYPITITAYNEDRSNGEEQDDSETFTLSIQNEITGPGPGTPAVITDFYQDIDQDNNGSTGDHGYDVSTVVNNTNITTVDADVYEGSVLREDTQFKLSDVVHVETDNVNSAFSITLKDVPDGVEIEGMTYNSSGGYYTVSGSGDQAAIVAKLQSILITPKENVNTNATDIANTDLAFDIELTTYASGGASNSALINFTGSVLPVTDEMNLTVDNDGATDEDVAQTFSITLGEGADGANTQIVDGKVYIKLTENFTDEVGADGTTGTLSLGGSDITTTSVSSVSGITDGDYYVITGATNNQVLNFSYTPAENRDGTITVDTYVKNIESESWTSYDPAELTSHQTFSFDVNAVTDGFTLASASASGTEDTMVPLALTLTSSDSSEKISSVSISDVPNGFLLYYGADAGSAVIAQNLGTTGETTSIEMTYGSPENVDVNTWNIPLTAGALPAYIGFKAPENWSGTISGIKVNSVDMDGNSSYDTLSVTVAPVVDSLSLNATQTFGKEGEDILLNLNANVEDLDGSETVTLTLAGFTNNANFKVNGEAIASSKSGDTYTIEGIAASDINSLTVTHGEMSSTEITATAKMVESDGSTSGEVTSTFDIQISKATASGGDDILLYDDGISFDGLAGDDTLVMNGENLTAGNISNIEELDLDAGENNISLTLADVISMTDDDNDIKISGDSGDSVNLTDSGWTTTGTSDSDGYIEYTNTDSTVSVKVEDTISSVTIA